ncbi:DUF2299 family protein [uncultured Methanobrevibacter sp.]|uniref:DUF2299 family protein n=1 Tax=uncultured Methanobrevibacter sp. TaxID=253161 RepID=UPI0026E09AC2|nr:DUF2299 family protein [uncultured Methanobrevibacter sp.]
MTKIEEYIVKNWIIDEDMFVCKIHDENSNFNYQINYQGMIMNVIQPKVNDDVLVIVCSSEVSSVHSEWMSNKTMEYRNEFLYDFKFKINSFDVEFDLDIDENNLMLKGFIIQDVIYSDGLTKDSFMRSLRRINSDRLSCVWTIEKYFVM